MPIDPFPKPEKQTNGPPCHRTPPAKRKSPRGGRRKRTAYGRARERCIWERHPKGSGKAAERYGGGQPPAVPPERRGHAVSCSCPLALCLLSPFDASAPLADRPFIVSNYINRSFYFLCSAKAFSAPRRCRGSQYKNTAARGTPCGGFSVFRPRLSPVITGYCRLSPVPFFPLISPAVPCCPLLPPPVSALLPAPTGTRRGQARSGTFRHSQVRSGTGPNPLWGYPSAWAAAYPAAGSHGGRAKRRALLRYMLPPAFPGQAGRPTPPRLPPLLPPFRHPRFSRKPDAFFPGRTK